MPEGQERIQFSWECPCPQKCLAPVAGGMGNKPAAPSGWCAVQCRAEELHPGMWVIPWEQVSPSELPQSPQL